MDHNLYDSYYRVLVLFGLFVLFFGLLSLFIKEKLYLTESLLAVLFGIGFGPTGFDLVNPQKWFEGPIFWRFLMELSRIVISFQVMAVGLCTPISYIKKSLGSILMLLGPGMVFSWGMTTFLVKYVLDTGWHEAMIVGACLSPTDPVLASAVIKGKFANRYIPGNLRNLLSVESGANDGLGFPFLMLPIFLTLYSSSEAFSRWIISTWAYEILFSIVIGFLLGYAAKYLLEQSEKHRLIDHESFLVYGLALSLSISGMVALISSDDLLSVFIAGNVFAYDDKFHRATKDAHFQDVLDMLFNISFFIYLGSIFPWNSFVSLGIWKLLSLAVLVLLLRRLPFVLLFKNLIPQLFSPTEAFFCGWFGPMGAGAIFFAMVAKHSRIPLEMSDRVFTVVSFVVLSSIIVHGITVPITHIHLKRRAKKRLIQLSRKTLGLEYPDDGYTTCEPEDPYEETLNMSGMTSEAVAQKLYEMR